MTKITLFDAAQQVREALRIDPDTGEISESFAESRELFEMKGGACIAYLQDSRASIAAKKDMLKRAAEQVSAQERHIERFESYIRDCMRAAGITKVTTPDGLQSATLYPDRDVFVELEEGATFPPVLCNEPKPPAPSKTKIRAAIEAGEPVAGARIVRRDRLTVR